MEEQIRQLQSDLKTAINRLKIAELQIELEDLEKRSTQSDFWQDNQTAAGVMQRIAVLKQRTEPWLRLYQSINDLQELEQLHDAKLQTELERDYRVAEDTFRDLKGQLLFGGAFDDHGAIISLSAGAGGTDAQDWTQMLLRMYVRFVERNAWQYEVVDQSPGEEAGLKSVTIEIRGGDFVYGRLKGEHGVHRLVRLSPFNADNLRQTSFTKVEVAPKIELPEELVIDDKDLKIDVFRSGGHGGQSVNTTDSAVRVTHLPTGMTIVIQNERSQLQNKAMAMTILRSRLAQLQLEQHVQRLDQLKGPSQSAEWGNQIRSYVMHPYKQVKDLRTRYETSDIEGVLDGKIEAFIQAYLDYSLAADQSDRTVENQ